MHATIGLTNPHKEVERDMYFRQINHFICMPFGAANRSPSILCTLVPHAFFVTLSLCCSSWADTTDNKTVPEDAFSRGKESFRDNRFKEACGDFKQALESDPANPEYLNCLGMAHACSGDSAAAITAFRAAIKSAPNETKAMSNLAYLYYRIESPQESFKLCNKIIDLEPESFDIRFLRGWCHYGIGNPKQGLLDAEFCLNSDPERSDCLALKALCLASLHRDAEAKQLAEELIESQNGHEYTAHFVLGNLLFRSGEYSQAEQQYSTAIATSPDEPHAYAGRAQLYLQRRNYQYALADLNAALNRKSQFLSLDRPFTLLMKAHCERQLGSPSESLQTLNALLEAQPQSLDGLTYRSIIHYESKNYRAMKSDLERLANVESPSEFARYTLARLCLKCSEGDLQDMDKAIRLAKVLYENGEGTNRAHYGSLLKNCYRATGQEEELSKISTEELQREPLRPLVFDIPFGPISFPMKAEYFRFSELK